MVETVRNFSQAKETEDKITVFCLDYVSLITKPLQLVDSLHCQQCRSLSV